MRKPCLEPWCPEFAVWRGRCRTHSKKREQSIARAGRAQYRTKRWAIQRRQVLHEEPMCCACRGELAEHVDHIDNNPSNNERSNLQGLCASCHSKKTRREQLTKTI